MILIFSELNDVSTDKIIRWLGLWKIPFVRFNAEEALDSIKLQFDGAESQIYINEISLSDFTFAWYRRGDFGYKLSSKDLELFRKQLQNEWEVLRDFLFDAVSDRVLGCFQQFARHNKLIHLRMAQKSGLRIPRTWVVNEKKELDQILRLNDCVVKPIAQQFSVRVRDKVYHSNGAVRVSSSDLVPLSQKIFPSLVQEEIEKEFEVRSFFLRGRFFSMAIFVRNSKGDIVDYRNAELRNLNRYIPFQLPGDIEAKLKDFMDVAGLDTGSIDLIYSKQEEFVFLEVNPNGQFDWLSYYCNYNLEKEIAKLLCNEGRTG